MSEMNLSPDTRFTPRDAPEPLPARSWAVSKSPAPLAASPTRDKFIGFARDEASATLLHAAFIHRLPDKSNIHIAGFRAALDILHAMATPEIVLIDLSGEDQPMNAVMELADAVEPGTTGARDRRHPECQLLPHRHQRHGHQGISAQTPLRRADRASFSSHPLPT